MLNKKTLVENRISELLSNAKHGNIGYIDIRVNGKNINYFNVNDEDIKIGLQYPITEENINNVLLAKEVKLNGDFYGDGFSGFLVETLNFITE